MPKPWSPLRFYRESREYMQGYSAWYFWSHFPKVFIVFYGLCIGDAIHNMQRKARIALNEH